MQKKLIALAVAALATGSAFAQSNVAISGYLSQGVAQYKMSGAGAAGSHAENRVDDGRYSRIRFTGTEDLGNGLKAEFQIETRFTGDTAAAAGFANGDTFVGINGGFGRVRLGRIDTFYNDGVLTELSRATSFASFATLSMFTQVNGLYAVNPSRHANQLRYDTPNFNGLSGTIAWIANSQGEEGSGLPAASTTAYSCGAGNTLVGSGASSMCLPNAGGALTAATATTTAGVSNPGAGSSWYAAARYFNGPIYVGGSYFKREAEGGSAGRSALTSAGVVLNPAVDAWRLYGSYTLPMGLKLGLNIDQTKYKTSATAHNKRTAWFIPVTYSFGSNAVYFTYGQAGKEKNQAGTVANSNAKFYNLGYDYALSKRTSVGANYSMIRNNSGASYDMFAAGIINSVGGAATTSAGMDVRQLYVGVNHNF